MPRSVVAGINGIPLSKSVVIDIWGNDHTGGMAYLPTNHRAAGLSSSARRTEANRGQYLGGRGPAGSALYWGGNACLSASIAVATTYAT
jgi:hypothetical protein